MDFIASFYPPLSERQPVSVLYLPTCFLLTLLPFLFPDRRLGILVTLPVLFLLCLWAPSYTFGSPSLDYYNSSPFFTMLLWYLDFLIFTPISGPEAPAFIGSSSIPTAATAKSTRKSSAPDRASSSSALQKLRWAFRLMLPAHRGIGWNWQVKGIPSDPNTNLSKWTYARRHFQYSALAYMRTVVMLVFIGFFSTIQEEYNSDQAWVSTILDTLIGWSGAIWVWDRLNGFYSLAAALSVLSGLCETWEWPPLTGELRDAWSVRQMWSVVYHQVLRRMLQQPAIRIARLLRLHKGSIGSRYTQLYVSFAISCLLHEFQIFNVTRKDVGEFAFFMSQPIAITAEDLVQWIWRRWRGQNQSNAQIRIGYIWVFFWFSYCLPIYVKGIRNADIFRDVLFEKRPLEMGSSLSTMLLDTLKT